MNVIDQNAFAQSLLEAAAGDWLTKSKEKLSVGIRGSHVPKFALRLTSQSAGNIFSGMHLKRQLLLRIEKLDEQRKTWRVGNVPEDFLALLRPQFVQRSSAQRAVDDDALRFGTIDNFPRLADTLLRWKFFVKFGFEAPPTPHSLDENRFEGEGTSDFVPGHGRQTSNVHAPTSNSQFRAAMPNLFLPLDVQCSMLDVSRFRADF
jgi:hypothetical protein